jgi:arginyl-tRNA--protein-N-Asp/Glu arginylyltransferase
MKLLFSESKSEYRYYIFPYAIWAIPEQNDKPSLIFNKGFLPASRDLNRFYMCRQIRIRLDKFQRSSENRRIFRKCQDIQLQLIPRSQFDYTPEKRDFYKTYCDIRFGKDVMTYERLDNLFHSKIISHLLVYTDPKNNKEVGVVTLYLEPKQLAYYYYAFYDLKYYPRNLGMYMMTSAVDYFAELGYQFCYLGTCYSTNALYKIQFSGAEFFNGFKWSDNLKELKYLIERDKIELTQHLLETEEYQQQFYEGDLNHIFKHTIFRMDIN